MVKIQPFQVDDGFSEFTDLLDTPGSYAGESGRAIIVKNTEDGLEFGTATGGTGLVDGYLPMPERGLDPTFQEGYGSIYTKDDGGTTELFYIDDGGTVRQLTPPTGGNTLNGAYDEGGAGAGRLITADAGAVQIDASGDAALELDGYITLYEISDPAVLADSGLLYAKDAAGITELFYRDSAGNVRQLTPTTAVGNTLDQAYDQGGAGVGRAITADSGALLVDASGDEAIEIDGYLTISEIAAPTSLPNEGHIYAKDDGGDTELFYQDASGNEVQITQDGSVAGGGANTLDQAYDEGGAGVGRSITADAGAVLIDASGDEALELDGYLTLDEISDPSSLGNAGIIYVKDVGGTTALFYVDESGALSRLDGYSDVGANLSAHEADTTNPHQSTLDLAYDGGGAGAGRAIDADSGAVQIDASGDEALDLDGYVTLNEIAEPTELINAGLLYTKDDGGTTELFYKDSDGTERQLTPGGGGGTLDTAYDFGGAGAGRSITADAGAVQIDASGDEALDLDGYASLKETTDPTATGDDRGFIYAKNDDEYGTSELFYMDDTGQVTQITQDGYLATYNSLRGIRLLEGVELPDQPGSFSLYAGYANGVTELFSRDDAGNDLQMTIQGRLGNGAIAAPGSLIIVRGEEPPGNYDSPAGWVQITPWPDTPPGGSGDTNYHDVVIPVAGKYLISWTHHLYASSSAVSVQYKLVFDEGESYEQEIGADANHEMRGASSYNAPTFMDEIELTVGAHTLKMYGQEVSGTTWRIVADAPCLPPQIYLLLVSGSGAGGILDDEAELSSDFSTSSGTFTDVDNGGGDALTVDVDVFEGEKVLILLEGYIIHTGGTNRVDVQYDVDGTVIPVAGLIAESAGANYSTGLGSYAPVLSHALNAGSNTIKVQTKVSSNGVDWKQGAKLKVIRFRGGLVPIQDDGYGLLDKPQALNFIGDNIEVTDNNGVADITILPDGYLILDEISDPTALADAGLLYTKDDGGTTELFYRDSDGNIRQLTPSTGGNTLDGAYDEGGAGVGRSITADSGAVLIDASGDEALLLDGYVTLNEIAEPTELANAGLLYTKDDAGTTELFYKDSDGTERQLTPGGGGANTLDQAYDQGGAGAGRAITADAGAVLIDASGDDALELDGYMLLNEITDPPNISNKGFVYAKNDDEYGTSELFYMDDTGQVTQVTQDGYLATYNSLRGVRLLEGAGLDEQPGSLSLYTKYSNNIAELFSKDSAGNETQLTVQGRVGNGATAAPGVTEQLVFDSPSGSETVSAAVYENINANFTNIAHNIPVAGLYLLQLKVGGIKASAGNEVRFRILVDSSPVTTDDKRWESSLNTQRESAFFQEPVELTAGNHDFTIQWERASGGGNVELDTVAHLELRATLVSGSGAGGVLVETAILSASFSASIASTWEHIDNGGGDELTATVDVFENEQVLIIFQGRVTRGGANSFFQLRITDNGVAIDTPATGHSQDLTNANMSFCRVSGALSAGSHSFKLELNHQRTDGQVVAGSVFQVIRFRGGLVPIQDDGYALLDKPQALNFIGDNVEVTDNNGVADITILPDGYLIIDEISDPNPLGNAGLVYTKEADGYTELHYMDDYGMVAQLTTKGSISSGGPTLITEWNGIDLSQFLYDGVLADLNTNGWVGSNVTIGSSAIAVNTHHGLNWVDITLASVGASSIAGAVYLPFDMGDIDDVIIEAEWMTESVGSGQHGPLVLARASGIINGYVARQAGSATDYIMSKSVGAESWTNLLTNDGPADSADKGGLSRLKVEGQVVGYNAQAAASGDFRTIVDTSHSTGKVGIGVTNHGTTTTTRMLFRKIKIYRP